MVTNIEDIKNAGVNEVALPGFIPGEPFIVKLRRPSLIRLAKEGQIPNQLLGAAAKLFSDGMNPGKDGTSFKEMGEAAFFLAKAALVEPSFEELEAAGIDVTDDQLIHIYLYTQKGVQMLNGFREKQRPEQNIKPGKSARKDSKRGNGYR